MRMKPKSRKEILDICQQNFWKYSPLNKTLIVISVVLSAAAVALYLCGSVYPTICGIIYESLSGWELAGKIGMLVVYYAVLHFANLLFVSIGGAAMCRDEGWDTMDFATAWMDMYKYEEYLDDENFEK